MTHDELLHRRLPYRLKAVDTLNHAKLETLTATGLGTTFGPSRCRMIYRNGQSNFGLEPHPDDHGPRAAARVPRGSYDTKFLQRLQLRGEVETVPENWNHDESQLSPRVAWVVYPNGDLQRVGASSER